MPRCRHHSAKTLPAAQDARNRRAAAAAAAACSPPHATPSSMLSECQGGRKGRDRPRQDTTTQGFVVMAK
ncbi:hypothetical protein E2C01_010290 [Portunus trituberculatus]|uniref:Uncharacterized protein n=1 Tax=Portunus trituberculatus TaxID=210409 RepID=A0A5B7D8A7_PORTR|nr:hypothetical protein [Portunus trituberculatus]